MTNIHEYGQSPGHNNEYSPPFIGPVLGETVLADELATDRVEDRGKTEQTLDVEGDPNALMLLGDPVAAAEGDAWLRAIQQRDVANRRRRRAGIIGRTGHQRKWRV